MFQKQLEKCLRLVAAATVVLLPWSSGAAAQELAAPADSHTVDVGGGGFTFLPDPQTSAVAETEPWGWNGFGHSTTSGNCSGTTCTPDNLWDSGLHDSGFTFDFTFTQTGTYNYYCTAHGPFFNMRGSIIVVTEVPISGLNASSSSPTPL